VNRRRLLAFCVFLGAIMLVPLGIIVLNEYRLATGTHVLLHVEPVDPNDPFRGEYVAFDYEISRLPVSGETRPAGEVYVVLEKRGRAWTGDRAVAERPSGDETFIRGESRNGRIEYGIETYYVEEGESPRYERAIARQELYVDVVLDDDGRAQIDKLVIVPN
jgi:uncharacterized membrane-anchored protein